jgi:hypothetical protein
MNEKNLAILLDWLGSLIMLGSVWGWMYGKLIPPIKRKLAHVERKDLAIGRLFFGAYERSSHVKRYRQLRESWGIRKDTPFSERLVISTANIISLGEAASTDPAREKEFREFQKTQRGAGAALLRSGRYVLLFFYYEAYLAFFTAVDSITTSLFVGNIGKILFVFGFLIWNISKGISLFSK